MKENREAGARERTRVGENKSERKYDAGDELGRGERGLVVGAIDEDAAASHGKLRLWRQGACLL